MKYGLFVYMYLYTEGAKLVKVPTVFSGASFECRPNDLGD